MKWKRTLQLVEAHCEGEIGKVITAGVIDVPGRTMYEKMSYLNSTDDSLVRLLMYEPRGCAQMAANLLLPPVNDQADVGLIVLQADGAHPMSGSNVVCVVTVLLETGMVESTEPDSTVVIDTPAGLVHARARCRDGVCEQVTLEMPPAFVASTGNVVDIDGFGPIKADVAFGGEYYVLVRTSEIGLTIEPGNAHLLARAGFTIQNAFAEVVKVQHPAIPELNRITNIMFYEQLDELEIRTCTTGMTGRVDRSPCGTGSTAFMALLKDRGHLEVGQSLVSRSIIDSRFELHCVSETNLGDVPAILCTVSGRAWIYGVEQLGLDPSDPFARGFVLSDTWGERSSTLVRDA